MGRPWGCPWPGLSWVWGGYEAMRESQLRGGDRQGLWGTACFWSGVFTPPYGVGLDSIPFGRRRGHPLTPPSCSCCPQAVCIPPDHPLPPNHCFTSELIVPYSSELPTHPQNCSGGGLCRDPPTHRQGSGQLTLQLSARSSIPDGCRGLTRAAMGEIGV